MPLTQTLPCFSRSACNASLSAVRSKLVDIPGGGGGGEDEGGSRLDRNGQASRSAGLGWGRGDDRDRMSTSFDRGARADPWEVRTFAARRAQAGAGISGDSRLGYDFV